MNFASEDRQELRWGFTLSQVLRAPKRPAPPPGWRPPTRFGPDTGGEAAVGAARQGQPQENGASPSDGASDQPQESDGDIVVEGRRERGGDDGGTTGATGTLRFASLATFDLRLFANLANRFRGKAWARGTRATFAIGNLFDTRQRVTDASGATPLID